MDIDSVKKAKIDEKQRAFSLIEILLALSLLAIVMSTMYTTYSNSLSIIKTTKEKALESRRRMILFRIIESDIQNIFYTRDWNRHNFELKKNYRGNASVDSINFITISPGLSRVSKVGDLREIGYFLKETDTTRDGRPLFTVYRREQIGVDNLPKKGGHISSLAEGVLSLTIECTGALGKVSWEKAWNYKTRRKYPLGVRFTLRFQSKNDPEGYNDLIIIGQVRQQRPKRWVGKSVN